MARLKIKPKKYDGIKWKKHNAIKSFGLKIVIDKLEGVAPEAEPPSFCKPLLPKESQA